MFFITRNTKLLKITLILFIIIVLSIIRLYQNYNYIYINELTEQNNINHFKQQYIENPGNNSVYKSQIHIINNNSTKETYMSESSSTRDCYNISHYKAEEKVFIGDCIVEIPKIQLQKIVYSGTNRESHLKNYELVTATNDMTYNNGGNYIICGHASQLYGHSLNRLQELQLGDEIIIYTPNTKDIYTIHSIDYIEQHNTSLYCNQTQEPIVTLLSCAKNISEQSYIVIKAIKQ